MEVEDSKAKPKSDADADSESSEEEDGDDKMNDYEKERLGIEFEHEQKRKQKQNKNTTRDAFDRSGAFPAVLEEVALWALRELRKEPEQNLDTFMRLWKQGWWSECA